MADKRISQLIDRGVVVNNDVIPIVVSGATTTNKATISSIQTFMQSNLDVGVTSVGITLGSSGTDVNVTGSPVTSSGNITINFPTASATNRGLLSAANWSTFNSKVSSVGLSMPSAFSVANSPITGSGTIAVTGAGTVSQYIRGDGSLADFPAAGGGGSSVNYYLNGSVSQGTIGGIAYQEMNKVPVLGAGTDFTIAADGYIASFITDAGDPALLEIPAGNWNFETYLQASSGGGTPSFYIELYKVNSGGTATLIASNSGSPELIAFGTAINPYFSALAVPQTTLALTDRLALRYYVTHSGRTITLHTENATLCQIVTTFTTGLTALNGLTAQVQNFATGTSGTDFAISSSVSTHTFNLPNASATARGVVTTGTQTFAGEKTFSNTITVNTPTNGLSTIYNGRSSDSVNIIRFNSNGASSLQNFIQSTPNDLLIGTEGNTPIYFVTNNGGVGGGLRLTISGSGSILAQGSFEANSIRKTGGTSSQFLKADGSVDSNTYLTTGSAGSTYVPYSGAAANVDLGVYNLTASAIIANGSGSNSGIIHLESNAFHSLVNGYGSITSGTTNQFNFYQTTGAGVFRGAFLSLNSITASATRTYTLPDADGTLALTSSLGAYLPLAGGTLTGALNGTSASFSGSINVGTSHFIGDNAFNSLLIKSSATENILLDAQDDMLLQTNGTTKLIIKNGGNVGINTPSPNTKLEVVGGNNLPPSTGTQNYTIALRDPTSMVADVGGSIIFQGYKTSTSAIGNFGYIAGKKENGTAGNEAGYLSLGTFDSSGIPSERMRITSGGNVLIGTQTQVARMSLDYSDSNNNGISINETSGAASTFLMLFRSNNVGKGSIQINSGNTGVNFNTTSDYRLKEDLQDYNGIEIINKIKTYDYKWKNIDFRSYGVLAHELQEIMPDIISGQKDEVDEEGNEIMQGVDYSKIVPVLIKAIQELKTEIDSLKNQIK